MMAGKPFFAVVDGGSRGTRVYRYAVEAVAGTTTLRRVAPDEPLGQTLEQLLGVITAAHITQEESPVQTTATAVASAAATAAAADAAAATVIGWLRRCGVGPGEPVYVGGTAGVRDAVGAGRVAEAAVAAFTTALADASAGDGGGDGGESGGGVRYETVSAVDEATYELAATRYAAAAVLGLGLDGAGLLSMGGSSSQLVGGGDGPRSFPCGCRSAVPRQVPPAAAGRGRVAGAIESVMFQDGVLRSTAALADESQPSAAAAEAWAAVVASALPSGVPRLGGAYVGISTAFWVAKAAGLASTLATAAEAKAAVRAHVAELVAATPTTAGWRAKSVREAEALSSAVALGVLLDTLFSDDATLYFERSWSVPAGSGNTFVSNWATGKALALSGLLPP